MITFARNVFWIEGRVSPPMPLKNSLTRGRGQSRLGLAGAIAKKGPPGIHHGMGATP